MKDSSDEMRAKVKQRKRRLSSLWSPCTRHRVVTPLSHRSPHDLSARE